MAKKIYRSRRKKMIGGVCGGIADYFDIDVVLIRAVFVISIFAAGTSLFAYIILWIMIPREQLQTIQTGGNRYEQEII